MFTIPQHDFGASHSSNGRVDANSLKLDMMLKLYAMHLQEAGRYFLQREMKKP
jgi:hypothetical protein